MLAIFRRLKWDKEDIFRCESSEKMWSVFENVLGGGGFREREREEGGARKRERERDNQGQPELRGGETISEAHLLPSLSQRHKRS